MKRILTMLAGIALWAFLAIPVQAQQGCQYVLGFADMAASVPQVGQCKENQHFEPP